MSVMNFEVQKRIEHRSPKSSRRSPLSPLKVWRALTAWWTRGWQARHSGAFLSATLVVLPHFLNTSLKIPSQRQRNPWKTAKPFFVTDETNTSSWIHSLEEEFEELSIPSCLAGGLCLSKGIPFSTGSLHSDQELANHILYIRNLPPITSTRFQLTKRVDVIGQFVS